MTGLYNMVCGGQTSRIEVASELLSILGLSDKIRIKSVGSSHFKEIYYAKRPKCERLLNRKLNLTNSNIMQDWQLALKQYIDKYYSSYLGI